MYCNFGAIPSLRLFIPLLLLTWGAIAPTVAADSITYQIVETMGSGGGTSSVSGTITTNGDTGTNLPTSDIISWDITVTFNVISENVYFGTFYTIFTPANSSVTPVDGVPNGFNATDQAITLSTGYGFYIAMPPPGPGIGPLSVEWGSGWVVAPHLSWEAIATVANGGSHVTLGYYPQTDLPIAVSVPEPSTATLAGLGALGVLVYRWSRHRGAKWRRPAA
jgi:PEP-CTERM motif